MIPLDLSNQTAIITGASQGLGAATSRRLHQAGANVVVNYFPDVAGQSKQDADRLVAELGDDRALALPADVRDLGQLEQLAEQAQRHFGSLHILVNNAAILRDRTLRKMSEDEWQTVIDTNLTGVFRACKAVIDRMEEGGRIVSIASIAAAVGFFGQSNYAAAKAGVAAMTRVLSRELASRQITVNAVAPGVVLTAMGKSIPEEVRQQMINQVPLRRFGEPDDIANTIAFLCSDLASYITGQTLHVNGGWWG
ncbi:3-oxoacyl-ACP reductase family protein [Phycisphaerales bacterium AB-hyl4]|uniref:3-oxoacyl-ACP reductase family protein n=1 Tax=Natronomicrosphaera hydrolytica TaxID=3242702 RepID=A0ABV4UBX3_9BACT